MLKSTVFGCYKERNFAHLGWLNLQLLEHFCEAKRPLGSSVQNLAFKVLVFFPVDMITYCYFRLPHVTVEAVNQNCSGVL